MKTIVVGGNFGETPKESSVARKISEQLGSKLINGGTIEELQAASNVKGYDLIIWAVNVDNEVEKIYPIKSKGAVLICTKVMREDRNFGDAVSRVFKMSANAVIAIDTSITPFHFDLIDALGNNWCHTPYTDFLVDQIRELYAWSKGSIRIKSTKVEQISNEIWRHSHMDNYLDNLCGIVKTVADKVENERGGRYFGNVSTRCAKMFPSLRGFNGGDIIAVSARNTPKDRLTRDDFVFTEMGDNEVFYEGDRKPSVDTPVQLYMYQKLKHINFMIHGHAYIQGAPFTEHYYPCGDLREVEAIEDIIDDQRIDFRINLRNHGFLIAASDLIALRHYAENSTFTYRDVGEEKKS